MRFFSIAIALWNVVRISFYTGQKPCFIAAFSVIS